MNYAKTLRIIKMVNIIDCKWPITPSHPYKACSIIQHRRIPSTVPASLMWTQTPLLYFQGSLLLHKNCLHSSYHFFAALLSQSVGRLLYRNLGLGIAVLENLRHSLQRLYAFIYVHCIDILISIFIIPLLRHFTILGQKNAQNMPRYYTVEQGKNTD